MLYRHVPNEEDLYLKQSRGARNEPETPPSLGRERQGHFQKNGFVALLVESISVIQKVFFNTNQQKYHELLDISPKDYEMALKQQEALYGSLQFKEYQDTGMTRK